MIHIVSSLIIFLFISFLLSSLFSSAFLTFCCCSVTKLRPTVTPGTAACQAALSSSLLEFSQIHAHWYYLTISFSAPPLLLLPSVFPIIRVFSSESALCIRWPKYWSLSFNGSPSNKYSGLISFRMDLILSPCSPKNSQESSPAPQVKSINSLVLSHLYGSNSHIHI